MKQQKSSLSDLINSLKTSVKHPSPDIIQQSILLSQILQKRSSEMLTKQEIIKQRQIANMINRPSDKVTMTKITDQAFRSTNHSRSVNQVSYILKSFGIPSFFSPFQKMLLATFRCFGHLAPGVAMPAVQNHLYKQTTDIMLAGEHYLLKPRLEKLNLEGLRVNVNSLGELLLGEEESKKRVKKYIDMLKMPEIEVISIKISTIYSQISLIAREHTIEVLSKRLETIYRTAMEQNFRRSDGTLVSKFVYLDMEEYQDLEITANLFMSVLDKPEMKDVRAGIVLQAYLPDSFAMQKRLTAWSKKRIKSGANPITIRIVKGANLENERVTSSVFNWALPQFTTKKQTDANYKRMLQYGMDSTNKNAVRLGIASHNLFDISYALILANESDVLDITQFEMLEGMANQQRRALQELIDNILLYAPSTTKEGFLNVIGYLIRRLDENTAPDNFLSHIFGIKVGGKTWKKLENNFVESFSLIPHLDKNPRRSQNRTIPPKNNIKDTFDNEPDTDFSLIKNVEWANDFTNKWKNKHGDNAEYIPLQIAGNFIKDGREQILSTDPSRPEVVVSKYLTATQSDVDKAVRCAVADTSGWGKMSVKQRFDILQNVAHSVRTRRSDLIGASMAECGKLVQEADPEVSEAVDFLNFYSRSALYYENLPNLKSSPIGPVVVVPPWNFPLAIPCGGIAAALAAGNTVVLKPASQAVLCSWVICQCFWEAGVPKEALQFVAGSGSTVGASLVNRKDIKAVILTGGTQTALKMLSDNPQINLLAETGGKNATIVSALSDREQAIKNVIHSAFGHSGQKCSATSLLILEEDIYDDANFKEMLRDAVCSLHTGSSWDFHTKVNPVIAPPSGDLKYGLEQLEEGEQWLVEPKMIDDNPCIWSPGVRWNVKPKSPSHMNEFFGPVLSVIKAKNLENAIYIANQTGYGLTSGIETLDEREKEYWKKHIKAGNLYINRPTTGAIVLRQPFGGLGKSAFGSGIKAGGPNYILQFYKFDTKGLPINTKKSIKNKRFSNFIKTLPNREANTLKAFIIDAEKHLSEEFFVEHDHFKLIGQDNIRRYIPVKRVIIRIRKNDSLENILIRISASVMAGCHTTISYCPDTEKDILDRIQSLEIFKNLLFIEQTEGDIVKALTQKQTDRIRYSGIEAVEDKVLLAVSDTGAYVVRHQVLPHARIELMWYFKEQSISHDYHRYGNLGERSDEKRRQLI